MLTFAEVILALKGRPQAKFAREGWNGKGMFITLIKTTPPILISGLPSPVTHLPYLAMYTVDGTVVPWLCSQTDALADDWRMLTDEAVMRIASRAPNFK